jgi:ribose 5-phosphate isomerase B
MDKMKISVGADERLHVVDVVLSYLKEKGYEVTWFGPEKGETQPWPEVARCVALDVQSGEADEGILFCWTGTGVSMAANKIKGIRAALCDDAETARGARLWNNANVLCLSIRKVSEVIAKEILDMWFSTSYKPNETDDACLRIIEELESIS